VDICLDQVCYNYPGRAQAHVIKHLSLRIGSGELVSLLGPSGCGKTTLLRCIAGFHTPDSGDIRIADASIMRVPPERRNISMVFQNYALFPHMTVAENIAFGLQTRRWSDDRIVRRVAETLNIVKMTDFGASFPRQLSGGQQQRIALARALAPNPAVLLLDEPLSNLDASLRVELRGEIEQIQKELSITTVYVTHDREEALAISDRVAVLNAGSLEQAAPPTDIYNRPRSRFVAEFLGRRSILRGRATANSGEVEVEGVLLRGSMAADKNAPAGANAWLALRPEDVAIDRSGGAGLAVAIASVDFAGSILRIRAVTAGGQQIEIEAPAEQFVGDAISRGQTVSVVQRDTHRTVIFDEGGGSRQ